MAKQDEPVEAGILGDLVSEIKKSRNPALAPETEPVNSNDKS